MLLRQPMRNMKIAIAKKIAMTQFFDEKGVVHPGTMVSIEKMVVTANKKKEKDGYDAVQFGFGIQKKNRINKPQSGQFSKLGDFFGVKEFRDHQEITVGENVDPFSYFVVGDNVSVQGTSKGKGFQGVVKRHGFAGGPKSHGQKHSLRKPGSIGGGGRAGGRVAKGMRMAGRMGSDTVTVKNLSILAMDAEKGIFIIKGAIPGRRGSTLSIISK